MRRAPRRDAWIRLLLLGVSVWSGGLPGCGGSPTSPSGTLPNGRLTGDGACLSVTDAGCNLAVGCGHGQFPKPAIRADGTFDVEGTYRVEVGPISIDPPPPAHFSGVVRSSAIKLTVIPTGASLQPATYSLQPTTAGTCPIPCV